MVAGSNPAGPTCIKPIAAVAITNIWIIGLCRGYTLKICEGSAYRSKIKELCTVVRRRQQFAHGYRLASSLHHRSQYLKLAQPIDAAHPDKGANRRILERQPFDVRPSYREHAKIHAALCLFCASCKNRNSSRMSSINPPQPSRQLTARNRPARQRLRRLRDVCARMSAAE